jgi:DNA-nicking Smr family endonuclease
MVWCSYPPGCGGGVSFSKIMIFLEKSPPPPERAHSTATTIQNPSLTNSVRKDTKTPTQMTTKSNKSKKKKKKKKRHSSSDDSESEDDSKSEASEEEESSEEDTKKKSKKKHGKGKKKKKEKEKKKDEGDIMDILGIGRWFWWFMGM